MDYENTYRDFIQAQRKVRFQEIKLAETRNHIGVIRAQKDNCYMLSHL